MPLSLRLAIVSIAVLFTSAASGQTCETWSVVENPVFQGAETKPIYILPFSADNAVGLRNVTVDGQPAIAYMTWDGTEWTVSRTDTMDFGMTWEVRGAALAPDDIWVSGIVQVATWQASPFLAHFDGQEWTAEEGITFQPKKGFPRNGEGADLVVIAPDDIWVIGNANTINFNTGAVLVCHWNGFELREFALLPDPFDRITDIHAADGADTNNIWAVGHGRTGGYFHLLLMYWDGASWTQQTWTPIPGQDIWTEGLSDVAAFGPSDAWAVGDKNVGGQTDSMYLHWDGEEWIEVEGPNIGPLTSVTGSGPDDVWASVSFGEFGGRMAHWNGTTWTEVNTAPIPGATHIGLTNLASSGPCNVWAIGYWGIYDGQGGWAVYEELIEHLALGGAETICPDAPGDFAVAFGGAVTGDALDLCASDDVRMEVLQTARLSPLLPYVRLEYWAHATGAGGPITSLQYTIESHVSALVSGGQNPDTLRTHIMNYATGFFENIDQRGTASNTDEVITHTQTTNAPDYVNAGDGEVRVRQDAFDPGNVFTPNWFLKVDLFEVAVGM